MASYGAPAFLNQLAAQIVAEIQTAIEIKKFTSNTAIIGQYVEASVRQFIRKYLSPIRISTGGVIDQDQTPGGYIPQLDTIAWIPGPVAAIFEVGDFGLVPRSSCLGILEIKSSAYSGAAPPQNLPGSRGPPRSPHDHSPSCSLADRVSRSSDSPFSLLPAYPSDKNAGACRPRNTRWSALNIEEVTRQAQLRRTQGKPNSWCDDSVYAGS